MGIERPQSIPKNYKIEKVVRIIPYHKNSAIFKTQMLEIAHKLQEEGL